MHRARLNWVIAALGIGAVFYAVLVLGFVATSPDLQFRCLVADETPDLDGVSIQGAPESVSALEPNSGDTLLTLNRQPTRTFLDFVQRLDELRDPPPLTLPLGQHPDDEARLQPGYTAVGEDSRFVQISFRSQISGEVVEHYVPVGSIRFSTFGMTLFWFACQLGILVIASLAYSARPFDVSARLFFLLCTLALGAFVGGFHWWVIASSPWLNMPFIVCAALVPPVSLHFFLTFPRPGSLMLTRGRMICVLLYVVPVVAIATLLVTYFYGWSLNGTASTELTAPRVVQAFWFLRVVIRCYIAVAGVYFLLTIVALFAAFLRTRTVIERNQIKWIFWASLIAMAPVGYSLYVALLDPVGLSLGRPRFAMFAASLLFTVAYAVSIVRHKLMWTDEIVSKGALYYGASSGLTAAIATMIALAGVASHFLTITLSADQRVSIVVILVMAIVMLLWLRDRCQRAIDQRFFREKYRLGRAFSRINRATGHMVEPESVAEMMVGTCSDVLHVDRVGLYLRHGAQATFQLAAVEHGTDDLSGELPRDQIVPMLSGGTSIQRVPSATRDTMSAEQQLLRELRAELLYPLEVDEDVRGMLVLGRKRGNMAFTAEDLTFLETMAQITTAALHSARANLEISRMNEELQVRLDRIADQRRQIAILRAELASVQPERNAPLASSQIAQLQRDVIVGSGPAIQAVLETVRKVASAQSTVLIRGESGTGKELVAQVLHENSPRHDGPLVRVHCAALASDLLESELFGHVRGAFTGAHQDRIGRFQAAHGGTLFLDEIGDISVDTQVKLLRVLQERCFEPVGGTKTVHVDVRLFTATNRNLEQLIRTGRFREDLFYRLNVISITIPPLRGRQEDLIELAVHFLNRAAIRCGKQVRSIDPAAMAALERYDWPGNVRELENVIERSVVLAEGSSVTVTDLPSEILTGQRRSSSPVTGVRFAAHPVAVANESPRNERNMLIQALDASDGNKAEAARRLGLPRSTFYSRLKKLGIA